MSSSKATKASKVTIYAVTGTSGRDEEKNFLSKVVSQCKDGSYLSSFFSKGALKWLTEQMDADVSCDLFEYYTTAADQCRKLDQIARAQAATISVMQSHIEDLHSTIKNKDHVIEAMEQHSTKQAGVIFDMRQELNEALTDAGNYQQQLINLKARLWDQEHPEQ